MLSCAPDASLRLPLHYANRHAKLLKSGLGYLQCSFVLPGLNIALHCTVLLDHVHLTPGVGMRWCKSCVLPLDMLGYL